MRYDEPMHGIQMVLKLIITTTLGRILTKIPEESFKIYDLPLKDYQFYWTRIQN